MPIPGTKQQRYVDDNAAAEIVLAPRELETLSEVFRPGAGAGERYPPGYFTTLGA